MSDRWDIYWDGEDFGWWEEEVLSDVSSKVQLWDETYEAKNGPLSGLQRKKWRPIIQKALLVSDSKFCVLYLAHYCRRHIVNTSLSAYVLLDFCVCVCNFGRQASQEKKRILTYC